MTLAGLGMRLTIGLAGACAVLGLVVGWELTVPATTETLPVQKQPARASLPEIPNWDYRAPPLAEFGETVERPLFMVDRRPVEPDQEDSEPAVAKGELRRPDVTLVGVVITPARRRALLQEKRGGNVLYLEPGMAVDDWKVKSVEPDRVVLATAGQTEELELRTFEEVAPVPGAQPGASASAAAIRNARAQAFQDRIRRERERLRREREHLRNK
jgi:general secretion pathway protein N